MARPNVELILALRETARRLRNGASYSWGSHGACNCGNLLQVLTPLTEKEILRFAQTGHGEWTELSREFCTGSGAPVDLLVAKLEAAGLTPTDIHHIEYLTDREVLDCLPGGFRWLQRNLREDVIAYFETLAVMLEERLADSLEIDVAKLVQPASPLIAQNRLMMPTVN